MTTKGVGMVQLLHRHTHRHIIDTSNIQAPADLVRAQPGKIKLMLGVCD